MRRWLLVDTLDGYETAVIGRYLFRRNAVWWCNVLNTLALPSSRRRGYRLEVRAR